MEAGEQAPTEQEPIVVRYDGLDADRHEMEMSALADSLRGLSRIIGVCGNLAVTHRYAQHKDAWSIRVVVRPPEAHCFELWAYLQTASQNPYVSGTAAGLTVTLIGYVFSVLAGRREEMRQLRGALDTAIRELGTRDNSVVERLLATIDRMAEGLLPSAKQAVSPIGETASTISVANRSGTRRTVLGPSEKAAITAETPTEVGEEHIYTLTISELDLDNGKCKIRLQDDPLVRFDGRIMDPVINLPNNDYAVAMAAHKALTVRGKPTLKDGEIQEIFISTIIPT
jgi:hypothetical protein